MVFGALKRIFRGTGAFAPADLPENRVFDEAPKPVPPYTRIVDKNGDEIVGRKPDGRDFLARPPVPFEYAGTIPKFNPNDYHSFQEKMGAAMEHAARASINKQNIEKAVFLLSQTEDGRRLLGKAERMGFKFVFDHGKTANEGAVGLCDYSNKIIPLAEGRNPEAVALTLKHELQHMEDIEKGITYHSNCTLLSSIMGDRALEANARVSEAVAAAELYLGDPQGPQQQFRSSTLFAHFFHSKPAVAEAAFQNLNSAKAGEWGAFALPVFKAYQKLVGTLNYYDQRLAEMYTGILQNRVIDSERVPIMSCFAQEQMWEQNQQALKDKITIKNKPTFLPDEREMDLASPEYTKFSDVARASLNEVLDKAKKWIPVEFDLITTGLFAPNRKADTAERVPETPFTNYGAEEPFKAIQHPERYDEHFIGGKARYAETTEFFQRHYKHYTAYESELDKISLATQEIGSYNTQNMYGVVTDLVEAGMRVPIAALPFEYTLLLCRNAKRTVETGEMAFSQTDLKLIRHWQRMSDKGLDPVYGSAELKETTRMFDQESLAHFNGYLKPFFDKLEADRTEKAQSTASAPSLAQVA